MFAGTASPLRRQGSHTHAGADLIGLWGYYLMTSGRDRDYVASVEAFVDIEGERHQLAH